MTKAEPPGMAKKLQDEKVRSGVWGGPGPRICEAVKKTKYRKTSKICFVVIPIFRVASNSRLTFAHLPARLMK